MSESALKAHLKSLRGDMLNSDGNELSEIRQESLDAYLGEKMGNERDGRSSYVTREVLEAVEWALPSLLRTFTAGDQIVVFDPVGPEDEAQAEQETDIVNHYLLNENNGFMAFLEWFKDALLYPNGYAKVYTEEVTKTCTEYYNGLDAVQLSMLSEQEGVEIVEATDNMDGTFDVKLKITTSAPVLRFEAVPPEQVLIARSHTALSLDDCEGVCHRTQRTKSWLLQAGYDSAKLEMASSDDDSNSESVNRLDSVHDGDDAASEANKKYWLEEWYLEYDFDGDGIAERRKVDYIGGQIFDNIEYDYQPICALSCVPMSHRHHGLSLSDLMRPIQELSTFFRRGINDNIAQIIEPRKYVASAAITDDGATLDQLLDPDSTLIEVRNPGLIEAEQHQPVIQEIIAAMNLLDNEKQVRSGIAPNLSLDPEVLQQSTMGGFTAALQEASQRIELIARIFAETGVKDAMLKAHRQIKEYQDKAKVIRIRGQWVETNPRDWKDRSNVTVNVGLGFNNKEKQVAVLSQLLEIQKEAMMAGLATPSNVYNTLEKLVESAGLKNVERYFTDPSKQPPQEPPPPDPMLVLAQQEQQMRAQKDIADGQRKDRELLLKEQELAATTNLKNAQAYKTTEEGKKTDLEMDSALNGPYFVNPMMPR